MISTMSRGRVDAESRGTCHRSADRRRRRHPRAGRFGLEILEDRVTPSPCLVTNAADPVGSPLPGSLRFEMAQANLPGNAGSTVEITAGVTAGTIDLNAGELPITSNMTIVNNAGHPIEIHQATAG